jgi:Flp pilus assembly protein TadD
VLVPGWEGSRRGRRLSRALQRQVFLALLLASPSYPCPQEPTSNPAAPSSIQKADDFLSATARIRAALDERPFHEQLFDGLVEKALRRSVLDDLVTTYAARHEADPEARAPRVLLARLLAHRGELERAEELLAADQVSSRAALLLRANWRERSGDFEQAMELYNEFLERPDELAGAGGLDNDQLFGVLQRLVDLQTTTGDPEGARSTLARLAERMPADAESRLRMGRSWGLAGFGDQERGEYRAAARAAGDDVALRCQALAALGAAFETAGRGNEALATYDEAVAALAPGHWQRALLFERALELRQASGTLEPWLGEFTAHAAESGNVAETLDLARVLDSTGCAPRAIAVLEEAHGRHPEDGELQDRLIDLAVREGSHELHVRLWQERVEAAPEQAAHRLQLASALRAAGEFQAAKRALATAEEAALAADKPELLRAIAQAWAGIGAFTEAERTLRKATTLAPGDVLLRIDLAQVALAREDEEQARLALSSAELHAHGDDGIALAAAWEDLGDPERAWTTLEVAAANPSSRLAALSQLAELALRHEWPSRARETLRELARIGSGAVRCEALVRLADTFEDSKSASSCVDQERARFEADASDPLPLLIEAFLLKRVSASPVAALSDYLQRVPDDLSARARLVSALTREGHLNEALEETDRLIARDPAGRPEYLLVTAGLLSSLDRPQEALTALELARRGAQRTPDLLRRIASRL